LIKNTGFSRDSSRASKFIGFSSSKKSFFCLKLNSDSYFYIFNKLAYLLLSLIKLEEIGV
jgi:hypothetical protein